MLARVLLPIALLAVTVAALGLRLLAAPSGDSIRAVVAAAPGASAYLATRGDGLVIVEASGARHRLGPLPTQGPLALAAGSKLVLGAVDGVFTSADGVSWTRAQPPGGHFLAVAASGDRMAVASWASGLWLSEDVGRTWRRAPVAAGDAEVTSISLGQPDLVGTLLGVLASTDRGLSWARVAGLPGRITAVDRDGPSLFAAAWQGQTYGSGADGAWRPLADHRSGIWALVAAAGAVATTDGVDQRGARRLAGREVTGLVLSGPNLFAFEPGGRVSVLEA